MTETVNRKIDVAIEPSVGEVAKLIWSMDSDEQAFLLHQLAYHFGKNKMKDWKAAVRTWEKRRIDPKPTKQHFENQNKYDFDDLERRLLGE